MVDPRKSRHPVLLPTSAPTNSNDPSSPSTSASPGAAVDLLALSKELSGLAVTLQELAEALVLAVGSILGGGECAHLSTTNVSALGSEDQTLLCNDCGRSFTRPGGE